MDPGVDEQSIMTYLSMFPKAQLKPGAPLKPRSGEFFLRVHIHAQHSLKHLMLNLSNFKDPQFHQLVYLC